MKRTRTRRRKYGSRAMYSIARKREYERREMLTAMRFAPVLDRLLGRRT